MSVRLSDANLGAVVLAVNHTISSVQGESRGLAASNHWGGVAGGSVSCWRSVGHWGSNGCWGSVGWGSVGWGSKGGWGDVAWGSNCDLWRGDECVYCDWSDSIILIKSIGSAAHLGAEVLAINHAISGVQGQSRALSASNNRGSVRWGSVRHRCRCGVGWGGIGSWGIGGWGVGGWGSVRWGGNSDLKQRQSRLFRSVSVRFSIVNRPTRCGWTAL